MADIPDHIVPECGVVGLKGPAGLFLDLIVLAYCFYSVSSICKYLMQSMQVLCKKLNVSPDIAGKNFFITEITLAIDCTMSVERMFLSRSPYKSSLFYIL